MFFLSTWIEGELFSLLNTSHIDPLINICRLALSSAVQAGTQKPAKPRRGEEEAMDASSQAEGALSAERWVMDSNSFHEIFIMDDFP